MPVANPEYNKADLPSVAPLGYLFLTKDTFELYVGTAQGVIPVALSAGPGMTFYVNASSGSDSAAGTSSALAFASIGAALSAAVSGRGDTILVMPGTYAENLVVSKDGITLVGVIPAGYERPDVTPASGIPLTVTGQGFTSVHMRYGATGADVVLQQSNGFLYQDNVFDGDGTASKGVRLRPSSSDTHLTASEGQMRRNLFRGCAIGLIFDTGAAPVGVGSTDNKIQDNVFQANTQDIAAAKTGAGGDYSVQTVLISGNHFVDKNKSVYIDMTTNADGVAGNQNGAINGNYFAADALAAGGAVKIVGTGFTFTGNYITTGIKDGSGLD